MIVLSFFLGLLGMAAHWYARYCGERTDSGFLEYFFRSEPKRSLGALCAYLGAFGALLAAGPVDGAQAWAAVFSAGYTADSLINRG